MEGDFSKYSLESHKNITPMMKQFLEVKKEYKDCIVLFRAGDFYETFYDDAKVVSKVLNITLTQRAGVPMAGVPYHSVMPYLKKLINNNYKVAICEQLEDPKKAKGVVKRGVTRVITPGTILEEDFLENFENNYIFSVYLPKEFNKKIGISIIDISTGEFLVSEVSKFEDLRSVIKKFQPREVIFNESYSSKNSFISFLRNSNIFYNYLSELRYKPFFAEEIIKKHFKKDINELGLSLNSIILSVGAALYYIYKLQKLDLSHIREIKKIRLSSNLVLDEITLRNLEIIESLFLKDNKKTLFGILNNTKTPMGARLLKKRLVMPSLDVNELNKILDGVAELVDKNLEREKIRASLDDISDIERISSRISSGIATPKDLVGLKNSLKKIKELNVVLKDLESGIFSSDLKELKEFKEVVELIESAIIEDAPTHMRDIGYIKRDFNSELKELYNISEHSRDIIKDIEEDERIKTGIANLKVKFNKVFGYYIEVPKSQASNVPEYYERKQTLVNAERFTIPILKEKEDLILNSEERIKILEKEIYESIIDKLKNYIRGFQDLSKKIALLDFISTNAYNAIIYNYRRPEFVDDKEKIVIQEGRNPVVERYVDEFIPNDIVFSKNDVIKIITGPNMSGKSTALRMVGLIVIMAQVGSFVPVGEVKLSIVDRIFTRIGAHDEISEGQSTFMVEMKETANILNNLTDNSLVLLDEIGRGTSTYDGVAIAWAVTEFLIKKNVKTIFATHYHYLNELEKYYDNVKNYHTEVLEEGSIIKFLRKIVSGGTDKSYGVYVAKIAGLPEEVVKRAVEIQESIESKEEIKISKDVSFVKKNKKKELNNLSLDKFFE